MVEGLGGGANPDFHCKRARSDCDDLSAMPQRERVDSFKTKLLGVSNPSNWKGFGDGKEKITIEDSDFVLVEGSNGQDVILSEELKSKLRKPWVNALILKIMGRSHSLNFMIQKLTQKWSLVGQWQLTDLEDGYFVARFQFVADLEYVLTEGPWMVTNQYLVVQRWRPNFVPGEEPIRVMPVWLRLSGLPMEWVDAGFLWKLGGILGKTCRVDQITEAQSRGRYARLCIEIDISKPLRSYMKVDGKIIRIEYENLSMVCFICGKVGHVQGNCKEGDMDQGTPIEKVVKNAELVDPATPYGPWMMVSYGRNGKYGAGGKTGFRGPLNNSVKRSTYGKNLGGNTGEIPLNREDSDGKVKDRTVDKSSAKVHCGSRPPVEEMCGTSKATETGIKQRPIVSKPISSKPVGGNGSRFDVLSEQMVEESDAIMEGKVLKGKDLLTTSGEPDTPLAAGKTVLRDIPNRGKTPRRDQMALKAGTSKIKKVSFPKKGLLNFRSPPILLQKEVVLNPNPVDDMEDACEDSEVLQSLHKDVLNSDMADKEKMRATSGAGKKSLVKTLSDFRKIYRFEVLAVLEPRISGPRALSVANKLGFSSKFIVDADGFSGGLWLLWNSSSVSLEVVASSRHTITFVATESKKCWVTTVVYANPSCGIRKNLWQYLNLIRGCFVGPWVVLGDFNEITHLAEKKGGRACFSDTGFRDWINANCLVDLGFVGQKFTWMTKRGVNDDIWCRLDRAVCSIDWRMMFPEGFVRHLPRINSDHCPIVLNLYSAHIPNNSLKPFRFEAMWSSHAEYSGLVSNCWTRNVGSLSEKLNALAANLKDWNRDSFGCIFRRKRVLLARILGIQKSLSFNYNSSLVSLEYHLSREYNDIINQEEMFWHQKSRNNWLRCGDRNTKFFHLSTMIRRRRNKIEGLRDVNGDWVDDKFGLKRIACDYFISLFSYKNASFDYASLPALFPTIDDISRENMCRGISEEEVKSSLFDIGGLKAPGPDGFPAVFFQNQWPLFPLLHSRITKHTYCEILEKTQKRLASWKSATLSMAGRVTLIKAVTAAIPVYSMQTIKLPNDLCCRLDKVNRDFLWGHTVDKKTVHLVNWRTVCTPKGNGGLGIKSTKLMNQSLLAKAGWRILQGDKGVWSQLLTCKYLNNANLLTPGDSDKSVCSKTWKGIIFGAKLLSSGINWRIGNGNSVHFWTDVWASDCGSLANHAAVALNDTLLSEKVKDYVVEAGWNLRKLATVLPWNIIHKITKIHIGNIPDKIIWGGCSKGNFSCERIKHSF
ncbi:hypothetical protein ACOSQ3_010206 [Xanthoceras sorbifolium]